MGLCGSSESNMTPEERERLRQEKLADKLVDKQQRDDQSTQAHINKLLLLGAGASGKSTLFKQMITIYGKGFPEAERRSFTSIIFNNILTSMHVLCKNVPKYGQFNPANQRYVEMFASEMKEDQPLTPELATAVSALWQDPGVQAAFEHQNQFQLNDSAKYFFDRISDIAAPGYVPTQQDVLRSRAPTTGIVENEFIVDGTTFKMYDVGGQRNERKKWIHCFENVTAVIFVAALSEYNQTLYEDESQNRLTESLALFEEICNCKFFRNTSMVLFLNKRDIFAEKIVKQPLSEYFPEYAGSNTYDDAKEWIRLQFEERNVQADKVIYTHFTCATDTDNVRKIFDAVKDIIIRKNLTSISLM